MKITVLGSGTAAIRKERGSPVFLIEAGPTKLLLDCGWSAGTNLVRAGYEPQQIDHIFISHPHADHMGNLINFIQSNLVTGYYWPKKKRTRALYLHGYKGFKKDYELLRKIMHPERKEKYPIKVLEYSNHHRDFKGIRVFGHEIKHVPYFSAASFRIEYKGRVVAYSGDCAFDRSLIKISRNANLAMYDCSTTPKAYREHGPAASHMSPYECGMIANEANVKKLLPWHLYDNATGAEIRNEIKKNFRGQIIIPKDFQVINI